MLSSAALSYRGFPAAGRSQDPVSGVLDATRFRIGVALLARKIAAITRPGETVGLLLPNANGSAVAFMARAERGAGRRHAQFHRRRLQRDRRRQDDAAALRAVVARLRREGQARARSSGRSKAGTFVWLEDLRDRRDDGRKARRLARRGRALARPHPTIPPSCCSHQARRARRKAWR